MKLTIQISILIIVLASCKVTKNKIDEDCKIQEVKYLTTYIDSRMWEVAGGNAKIDLNAAKEMANMESEKLMTANFFVPIIIKEIKNIYGDSEIRDDEKLILIELSKVIGKIWNDSRFDIVEGKSRNETCIIINSIFKEYHKLSEDDSHFYKMIFTMDDGPFYGFDTNKELEKLSEISFDQFKLVIRGDETENTLELVEGINMKWRKIIARSEDYKIKNLNFANEPVRVKNELGYKIALSGEGELIQLYLTKNGDFRLFFHSW